MALLICAIVLALKGLTSGWSLVGSLFLFPTFLILVSALSVTGRWDLYQWERRSGRFVRYDSEEFPGRAKLWQVVSILFVAFFLTCFALYDPVRGKMSWQYGGSAEVTAAGLDDPQDTRPHE